MFAGCRHAAPDHARAARFDQVSALALALACVLAIAISPGCGKKSEKHPGSTTEQAAGPGGEPLFGNLGPHHRAITTSVPAAQQYFDQGLVFVYSFNHDEAIRSFQAAAALDSSSAMAYWGIALANGPHINNPAMDEPHSRAAWAALTAAQARVGSASDVERALIEALSHRYADPIPEDRRPLDEAYAAAMRTLWQAHPEDADIGALCAEALMDLRPWDLWDHEGLPQPGTDEIVKTIETVLKLAPEHPLANHLYIHAVEASPHPELAVESADRLRTLVPGAGHMVHMPAHIYVRLGRWADAATQNELAVAADRAYRARSPHQEFYRVYMAHNHHFLAWSCQMQGRSEEALRAAREMIAGIPLDFLQEFAFFADGYMTIEMDTLMRFGRWEDILKLGHPPEYLPISNAMLQSIRGVAYAARGQVDSARSAQAAFETATTRVTEDMIVGNNSAQTVLSIARHLLEGEILAREGKIDQAVAELEKAVEIEDSLRYNEAPDWLHPVRHALGAVLVRAERYRQAEQVYRDDLARNRENGWALQGLATCLRKQRKTLDAEEVEERFREAWTKADVKITTSCFCQAI